MGSEMCIRDSDQSEQRTTPKAPITVGGIRIDTFEDREVSGEESMIASDMSMTDDERKAWIESERNTYQETMTVKREHGDWDDATEQRASLTDVDPGALYLQGIAEGA